MHWSFLNRPSLSWFSRKKDHHGPPAYTAEYARYFGTKYPVTTSKRNTSVIIVGPHPPRTGIDESDEDEEDAKPAEKRGSQNWFAIWWLEILGIVFSLACTGAIVGILCQINGRPLRNWRPTGIAEKLTPNALVSILSTLSKATLMFSVAQGLGQLKWNYFKQKPRRLYDLQIFDDATRGPTGALTLIYHLHIHTSIALLGALIIILSLAVDVTVQQVLTFPIVSVVADNATASVGYVRTYATELGYAVGQTPPPGSNNMSASFSRGLYGFDAKNSLNIFCGSGNCSFPPIDTLGICSSCEDISDQIVVQCSPFEPPGAAVINGTKGIVGRAQNSSGDSKLCTYTAPNGHRSSVLWSLSPKGVVTPSWLLTSGGSQWTVDFASFVDAYRGKSRSDPGIGPSGEILNMTVIITEQNRTAWQVGVSDFTLIKPKAHQCRWNWCAQRYSQLRYHNGTIQGNSVESRPLKLNCTYGGTYTTSCIGLPEGTSWPSEGLSPPSMFNRTADDELAKTVDAQYAFGIKLLDASALSSFITSRFNGTLANGTDLMSSKSQDIRAFRAANQGSIPQTMKNLAESFNQMLRESTLRAKTASGTPWTSITLVTVNWPLLIYPAVLPILGAIFLILTMTTCSDVVPWKSSILALLYHGLEGNKQNPGLQNSDMESASKTTMAQLDTNDCEARLLVASDASTNGTRGVDP